MRSIKHRSVFGLIGKVTNLVDDSEVELSIALNMRARLAWSGTAGVRAKGDPIERVRPIKGRTLRTHDPGCSSVFFQKA
jgi:hypothetical protein